MKKNAIIFCLLICFSISVIAQREKPASEAELMEITKRGKMLADYDVAAWHSTDAVMEMSPKKGSFELYIAQKVGDIWQVAYGKLNETQDKFLIVFLAIQQETPKKFKVEKFNTPKEDMGFFFNAAKSIETAKEEFTPAERRPYNVAILPAKDEQFYVYFLPAQTELKVFPLGGDIRLLVSKDGSKVLEKRQLHKSIIEFQVPPNVKPETGYHTAILDDIPEDTDVFHVLAREPKIPELVVTQKFVYQIAVDGTIRYLMTTEAFKKVGN